MSRADKIKKRLAQWHRKLTGAGGNGTVVLERKDHDDDGKPKVVATITTYWRLRAVKDHSQLGESAANGESVYIFEFAYNALSVANAKLVATILHSTRRYTVELQDEPLGNNYTFVFLVKKYEDV